MKRSKKQKQDIETTDVENVDAQVVDEEEVKNALIGLEREDTSDRRGYALTDEDRDICAQIHRGGGVDFLRFEKRWNANKIRYFMARVAVQEELEYLRRLYSQREGIQERTQFFAQLKINSMVPAALNVIARTLRGDMVKEDGTIVRSPARSQFDAAMTILDRANINNVKYKGNDSMPSIDARSVKISLGEKDEVDLSSREARDNVRGFVDKLLNDLTGTKKNASRKKKKKTRRQRTQRED